ncbi:transposase [Texcoconibacillus texcoconensis]|uniref:Putative transposase YdaD n=1 Tax=Texcoconibacillus texcoconensis TaxID=1095777 RepID=A0A840QM47_9BACI|nr:transposase [Texcoconibacillus texcoconensis]MBB5172426.1 putative transposase YdaD [Texcoconibacillus texcoconensis]
MARQTLLSGFFETYLQLSPEEEEQLISEVKKMDNQEGEKVMELMVSYERKGIVNVAKNMLKMDMEDEVIVEATGLSHEEVRSLKEELDEEV